MANLCILLKMEIKLCRKTKKENGSFFLLAGYWKFMQKLAEVFAEMLAIVSGLVISGPAKSEEWRNSG
jgi:hypothetical protein